MNISDRLSALTKFFGKKSNDSTEAEEYEQDLIESVEEFSETITREVMVPRIDIATVAADLDLDKAMAIFLSSGYSRLPVTGKTTDDILGILYLKDVAKVLHETPKLMFERTAEQLARKAVFVPESKALKDLLQDMQRSSTHVAVVIDEYGGVAGLVTMEDVIEELVGDIVDEYDREIPDVASWVTSRLSAKDIGAAVAGEAALSSMPPELRFFEKLSLWQIRKMQRVICLENLEPKEESSPAMRHLRQCKQMTQELWS